MVTVSIRLAREPRGLAVEKTAREDGAVRRWDDGNDEASEALGGSRHRAAVPQPDDSMTRYTGCRYTRDPGALSEAVARGSLCAR
jgi:hypothetical protein